MLLAVTSFASCEEDLMDFEGEESLYFDARWYSSNVRDHSLWPHRLHTAIAFGNTNENDITVEIPIRTTGEVKDFDRKYQIEIVKDSTNAVDGREYSGLVMEGVIKAGALSDTLKLTAHRTNEIHHDTLRLQIRVLPNEHFTTNFTQYEENGPYSSFVNIGGSQAVKGFDVNNDARIHNIFFYDCMIEPKGWWAGLGGPFSEEKITKMMEVCGVAITEFETKENMPSIRFTAYCEKLGKYLIEQAKKGREYAVLEKDGTMMHVPYCSTGDPYYKWGAGKKPEDCPFYK